MKRSTIKAFSLVELLVVIAIISVLMALLLPAIQKVRESAGRARCLNNLRQVGLAFQNYHDAYGCFAHHEHKNCWSPLVQLLPYLEENNLYQQIDTENTYSITNPLALSPISTFTCPSRPANPDFSKMSRAWSVTINIAPILPVSCDEPGPHDILVCVGDCETPNEEYPKDGTSVVLQPRFGNGVNPFEDASFITIPSILDGVSNTILAGETYGKNSMVNAAAVGSAYFGINETGVGSAFRSNHSNGANFVMCDGSVHFIKQNIDQSIFRGLATIAGGEIVSILD